MTVKSNKAWNNILQASVEVRRLAEQIFGYANEWSENDTSVEEGMEECEHGIESVTDFNADIPYSEDVREAADLLVRKIRKATGARKVTINVRVGGSDE